MAKKLLVMAGGTGGHVFPGLAVAKVLQQQGWEIRWLGTEDRMEAELVPKHGIDIDFIKVKGLRGQSLAKLVKAPFQIVSAIAQARKHIKRFQPDVVLGMGGYVSGPGGIAARMCGIPLVLHEQNAVAGLTNEWLAKVASKVFQAFPGAFPRAEVVGNPVRDDVLAIEPPQQRLAGRSGPVRVLVMGGSQGARILNHTLPEVFGQLLKDNTASVEVRHQCGKGNTDEVSGLYQQAQFDQVDVSDFIDDVAKAYRWADLVVCRAGALTVSEVCTAGVAAIFIPFQHKDRQQALNADYLVDANAALMIEQPQLSVESLKDAIQSLDREALKTMAIASRKRAKTDAAQIVANAIIELQQKS